MDRRFVLTGLAALATGPALAQSSPAPPTDAPAAPAAAAPAAEPAPAPAMKMAPPLNKSDAATTHMTETMRVGSLSLLTSRIAEPKVRHPALKRFAGFEIAEQETIASILGTLMMPGAPPTGTVATPTDAALTANLDAKGKGEVEALRAMKAGPEFERDYVKAQLEGHRALLKIQDAYLQAPDGVSETILAKLAKGMVLEHLALLEEIERQLRG